MIVVKHKYIAARGKGGVGKVAGIGKAMAHVKYIQFRPGEDRERGSAGRDRGVATIPAKSAICYLTSWQSEQLASHSKLLAFEGHCM